MIPENPMDVYAPTAFSGNYFGDPPNLYDGCCKRRLVPATEARNRASCENLDDETIGAHDLVSL